MRSFFNWFDPRCRETGLRFWHYLVGTPILVLLIGLAIGFGGGYIAGTKYGAAYWMKHYRHDVQAFHRPKDTLPISRVPRATKLPESASVNLHIYPSVGDQDGKGACAAFATAWSASFEARLQHLFPGWPKFSAWYLYNAYGHGADQGSSVEGDIPPFMTTGVPRYSQLGRPIAQWPQPMYDDHGHLLAPEAAKFRMQVALTNGGVGENGLSFTLQALAAGHPVQFAFPVHRSFFGVKTDVPLPTSNDPYEGGHEMVFIAYDFHHTFPDGSVGLAFLGRNQWTRMWGQNGNAWFPGTWFTDPGPDGNGLIWDLTSMTVSPFSAKPPKTVVGASQPSPTQNHPATGQGPTFVPPPLPKEPTAHHNGYWLKKTAPYAAIVNAAGKHYNVWPVGIMALMETESNLNPYIVRCVSYYDCSAGLTQVSVPTARQYGVEGTTDQVLNWEKVPSNDIWLAARVLVDARKHSCEHFSPLYAAYNQGWFLGCHAWQYHTPPAGYAAQAYRNYQGWLPYVAAKYS